MIQPLLACLKCRKTLPSYHRLLVTVKNHEFLIAILRRCRIFALSLGPISVLHGSLAFKKSS